MLFRSDNYELRKEDVDTIRDWIDRLRKSVDTKNLLRQALAGRKLTPAEQQAVAYNVFDGLEIARLLMNEPEEIEGIKKVNLKISSYLQINSTEITDHVRRLVIQIIFSKGKNPSLAERYMEFLDDGRIR